MTELFRVLEPARALELVRKHLALLDFETVELPNAPGRVLARDVVAAQPLPPFDRSTMDGYAVRAADTYGASEGQPAELKIVGELSMGAAPELAIGPGQAAVIHTGGMLCKGADAVVPVEYTQSPDGETLEVMRPVGVGQNVLRAGEDFQAGDVALRKGTWLGPAETGLCAACGLWKVEVVRRPVVGVLSQGDELVHPSEEPAPGKVRDVNTYSLAAAVERAGGTARPAVEIAKDDLASLESAALGLLEVSDILVMSAGSSVSARDLTSKLVARLGKPGLLAHGLAVRPGKPTVVAVCDGKPVIGLPGNPVSALVVFRLVVEPLIAAMMGAEPRRCAPLRARLSKSIASVSGREDRVAVRLTWKDGEPVAEPVPGRSNSIGLLVRADGLAVVPRDSNGIAAGQMVTVEPLGDL